MCTYRYSHPSGCTFKQRIANLRSAITTHDLAMSIIMARAFNAMISFSGGAMSLVFILLQCYLTHSRVLFLPNGGNPVASWPNSIPKDGSKIDTDPHTFGCI